MPGARASTDRQGRPIGFGSATNGQILQPSPCCDPRPPLIETHVEDRREDHGGPASMAVMINSWPLPRMPLRFLRTGTGTYQTIIGEAPQRTRYTITGRHRKWCVERSIQQPGGDWAIVSVHPAESLKDAMDWCDVDARKNGALPPPAVAAYRAGAHSMA